MLKTLFQDQQANPICQTIKKSQAGLAACDADTLYHCKQAGDPKHQVYYPCHAGLVDFAVPVYFAGRHIATINGGQMLAESADEKNFKKLCKRLKGIPFDEDELRDAYFRCAAISAEKLKSIVELISHFAEYFCEMNLRLIKLQETQQNHEIYEAEQYIKKHFKEAISRADVASQIGLSESHFSRLFVRVAGISFSKYLNHIRLDHAKKLLNDTDWTIARIAFASGYASLPHFGKVFRKREKCSPREFRVKMRVESQ